MSRNIFKNDTEKRYRRRKAGSNKCLNGLRSSMNKKKPLMKVWMSSDVSRRLDELVRGDPEHECGAFLIGTAMVDKYTGNKMVFVIDMFSDYKYGGAAEYSFSTEVQTRAMLYIRSKYGTSARIVGTAHSHARFSAFFSSVDDIMMKSHGANQTHMVISPSSSKYVLTLLDENGKYHHDIGFQICGRDRSFRYERRKDYV